MKHVLEGLDAILEDLIEDSYNKVVLVEGSNDSLSLRRLGIEGDYFHIQSDGGPVRAAEYVYEKRSEAIILTDWDDRGERILNAVADQLSALCVKFDTSYHRRLRSVCRAYVKDVESLYDLRRRLILKYGPVDTEDEAQ